VREKKPRGVFVGDKQIFERKDLFNSGKFCKNNLNNFFFYIMWVLLTVLF